MRLSVSILVKLSQYHKRCADPRAEKISLEIYEEKKNSAISSNG